MKKVYKRKDNRRKIDNEFKYCDIKDLLLCNPYSQETIMKIDEDEFYNYFYCDINFKERIQEIDDELTKIKSAQLNNVNNDVMEEINNLENQKKHLIDLSNQKNNFENNILSDGYRKARYICGNSGSGKSTYLGFLLRKLKKNYHYVIKFDLAETCERVNLCGNMWHNIYYERTLGQFISVLINCLNSFLSKNKGEEYSKYINRLQKYVEAYKIIYYEDFRYCELFEAINGYVELNNSDRRSYQKFLERLNSILNAILFLRPNNNDYRDENGEIKDIIYNSLSIIVLFAMAEKAIIIDDNLFFEHKIIIAIDSLEHYINFSEVYNKDIADMCELIDNFILSESNYYNNISDLQFSNVVKFIITFRDTTAKMLPDRNAEDFALSEVNITDWFLPSSILLKRTAMIKKASRNERNIIKALEVIVNDDVSNYSFWGKIEQMHNYNKRRLFIYLCDALDEKTVDEYLSLWDKAEIYHKKINNSIKEEDKTIYNKMLKACKNAARSSIIRALMNKIDERSYFEHIFTIGQERGLGKSYVRRILTYICAKKREENKIEGKNYISFNRLLRDVFMVLDTNAQRDTIHAVAEVLYNMNNSSREDTHWCQLIVIKFNDSAFTLESLVEKIVQCIDENNDGTDQYGVKVTNAGRFFLNKLADFEYFACRYCRNSLPLFFNENFNSPNGSVKALQIIQNVRERALMCVEEVKAYDIRTAKKNNTIRYRELYSYPLETHKGYLYISSWGREMTHAQRILDSHISYLDQYRNFVLESRLNDEEKKQLSLDILKEISTYVTKMKELVNLIDEYGNYYIGGDRTEEQGKKYYQNYELKIKEAKENPTEHIWIQR